MPKVSVILPTHNRAGLLEKAIQSALDQTYQDIELLVWDDASTDNTKQVVESITDERLRYTRNETNKGVVEVRNSAIRNSNGEFIAFLDDDDEWLPDKLEKQIDIMEGSPAELGGVYTGAYAVDMKLGKLFKLNIPEHRGNILQDLLKYNFIITSSLVLKKACFEKVGFFDTEYKSASDFDMWIRIAVKFEFDYVEDPLVTYRIHQNSISTNYLAVIKGWERLITKHRRLFENDRVAYSNHLLKLGVAYCYNENTFQGRQAFINAIQLNPLDMRLYYNLVISVLGADKFRRIKEIKRRYSASRLEK